MCRNQSVCPDQCNLCACNPDKRCEHAGEFAPKHVEKCKLTTRCEAPLQIALCGAEESQEGSEAGPSTYIVGPDASSPNHFYLAVLLTSVHVQLHDLLLCLPSGPTAATCANECVLPQHTAAT